MAWEWVEPVASPLAGVLGAVVGIFGTLKATKRQGEAQVQIAREERQQRRLEASYMELLTALSEIGAWARSVFPMMGEYRLPPMPDHAPQREALLTAYWSPRIQRLMDEWNDKIREIWSTGIDIESAQAAEKEGREYPGALEAKLRLPTLREDLWAVDKRIREQVRRELLGQDDGQVAGSQPSPP